MTRFFLKFGLASGFAAGAIGLTADAADDKKPADKVAKAEKPADQKAPDWSNYATFGEPVTADVVKADESGITLRLPKLVASRMRGYGRSRGPGVKLDHQDVTIKYADGGMVRWKKLPPKIGADGKKGSYTDKELSDLQKPIGMPGYAAEKGDLQPGHIVEVHLVRPRIVPEARVTQDDLLIKYAKIIGQEAVAPTPDRKDTAKGAAKKNN